MTNTRKALKRHRDLIVILFALCVAFWVEPSFTAMTGVCRDLLNYWHGGALR